MQLAVDDPVAAPAAAPAPLIVFRLPGLWPLVRRSLPLLTEAVLLPTAAFYLGFWLGGIWGGLTAATVVSYGALGRRVVKGDAVGGLLLLAVLTLSVRVAVTAASGNAEVYFLQPVFGEAALGLAFLASLLGRRCLAHRLAHSIVPLEGLSSRFRVRHAFAGITLLWAVVLLLHALMGLWLLTHYSPEVYVAYRAAVSTGIKALAVAASVLWFRAAMRRSGVRLAFG